jgi:glycosyltransferase involved in cell wall biosynthesis
MINNTAMSNRNPKVSVGLPVYNGAAYLAETIDALLAQTYEDFELLISDNASTDATQDICRGYAARDARIHYERQEQNQGPPWNFNRVFQMATGDYFKWAAHDDLCAPTLLTRCVEALDSDPSAENGQLVLDDGHGKPVGSSEFALPLLHDHATERRLDSPHPHVRYHSMLILSTRCYEVFGLIRTSIMRKSGLHREYCGGEKVFLAELSLLGRFLEVPETLLYSRWHADRFSSAESAQAQRRHFAPQARRKTYLPRQVRCSWGYATIISKTGLTVGQRLRCYTVLVPYLFQVHKWRQILGNAVRGKDTVAVIPPGARRGERPAELPIGGEKSVNQQINLHLCAEKSA